MPPTALTGRRLGHAVEWDACFRTRVSGHVSTTVGVLSTGAYRMPPAALAPHVRGRAIPAHLRTTSEFDGQLARAAHRAFQPFHRAGETELRDALQELLHRHRHLHARQVGSDAAVAACRSLRISWSVSSDDPAGGRTAEHAPSGNLWGTFPFPQRRDMGCIRTRSAPRSTIAGALVPARSARFPSGVGMFMIRHASPPLRPAPRWGCV